MTQTIHWLGAGLSSIPGIKQLAQGQAPLIVYNRTLSKAQKLLADVADKLTVTTLDWDALTNAVKPGDVVVSMLPATQHLKVAELCLAANANFVSSSYIAPEMAALDEQAKQKGLCLVNEVGLDPGIDHLLAHLLVNDYRNSSAFAASNALYFRSYCGGFPKVPNDFKYKFSWSPLGVLKALRSPAKWLEDGAAKTSTAPWDALSEYKAHFGEAEETFVAYPNRDSVPFVEQYQFDPSWNVQEFVRGTLRLNGWDQAWQHIFDEVATLSGEEGDARLAQMSEALEKAHSYDPGEADRVVLCVELEAKNDDGTCWHQSYQLDAYGNEHGHAMGRLVSLTVSIAVEAVLAGNVAPGVSAAPHAPEQAQAWLDALANLGESTTRVNKLAG